MRGVLAAFVLAACGVDVVGVDPASLAPSGPPGAPGPPGGADAGAGSMHDASVQIDSGNRPATDAKPCASCPAGTPKQLCIEGACQEVRRVFVTRQRFQATFQNAGNADQGCQTAASVAGLGGTWMAWFSDGQGGHVDPIDRIPKTTVSFRLLDTTLLAASWDALMNTDGQVHVAHAIDLDETGKSILDSPEHGVWTGTTEYGYPSQDTCNAWTKKDNVWKGRAGNVEEKTSKWNAERAAPCDATLHLYCFEL